ncbi:MAG: sulfatase family protein [Planctomycetota bacterium]|jgi:arylsulfatase A-like enzyme
MGWRHSCTLFLAAIVGAGCSDPDDRPDVLVVTLDTFRADHMSVAGYPRSTTPRLDALAASGVRFERCRAPMSTTLPSHLSLFTGTHPLRHGVLSNISGGQVYERDRGLTTLAEVFEDSGYRTGAFVSSIVLRKGMGLVTGFDEYDVPDGSQRPGQDTLELALDWWSRAEQDARFMWVHLFDPHLPHIAPDSLQHLFRGDDLAGGILEPRGMQARPELVSHLNAYDRELVHTDALVGELLDAVGDDTIVLVVGDHGEGLWQHGWEAHGYLWEEQLRVPAILRAPDLEPRVEESPSSVMDLAPLLLEQISEVDGEVILEQAARTRELLGDSHLALATAERSIEHAFERTLWIEGPWALIRRVRRQSPDDVEHDLYHLDKDPHQLVDRSDWRPGRVNGMEKRMLDTAAQLMQGAGGRTRRATAEERAHLEALGYGAPDEP